MYTFASTIQNSEYQISPVIFGLVERGAGLAPGRVPHLAPRERLGERVQPPPAVGVSLGVLAANDLLAERVEFARVVDADVELARFVVELELEVGRRGGGDGGGGRGGGAGGGVARG